MIQANNSGTPLNIFIISDSIGETGHRAARAALAQFDYNDDLINVQQFPFINTIEDLMPILDDALKVNAVILTTLVNVELNHKCHEFTTEHNIIQLDYLNDLINIIKDRTDLQPAYTTGALQALDKDYFNRIEAIEFAVKYDDGKNPAGLLKADLVILGISRTSKTPLSIFLANKGYKVTNLPIVPEVTIPKALYQVPRENLIGLYASADYIRKIRSERIQMMGLKQDSNYNSIGRIRDELNYFNDLAASLRMPVINIENKSIEETAQYIENSILKHKHQ